MQAGKLNQRIKITPVLVTESESGSTKEQPDAANAFSVWADVRQQGAAERARNGITTAENTYVIQIRYRAGLTASCFVEYRGRRLDVSGVVEGGRQNREWMTINATEAK